MTAEAETLFKDHKSKSEIMSIADTNTVARRMSALSADAVKQLEQDVDRCKWFSIQCDESVDPQRYEPAGRLYSDGVW